MSNYFNKMMNAEPSLGERIAATQKMGHDLDPADPANAKESSLLNEAKVNVQALRRDSAGSATSTTSSSTGGFGNHEPGPTLGQRISATQKLGHDIDSADEAFHRTGPSA